MDRLALEDNEDYNWNTIGESEVTITNLRRDVALKIPYAALRF